MRLRAVLITGWVTLAVSVCHADEVLYRYEGDILPSDPQAGWLCGNPCEAPCSESIENGRYTLRWVPLGNDNVACTYPLTSPPPTLWVEWRFRSDQSLGSNTLSCDGLFDVSYESVAELVDMWGDAVLSFSGDDFVLGLDISEFHTHRFESLDGENYRFSVDGQVFHVGRDTKQGLAKHVTLRGSGGCGSITATNEWDYVRFGAIGSGETVVSTDPPSGDLDKVKYSQLDRFTVTFDAPNYVYIEDVEVLVTGGDLPQVSATRRREQDEPDTIEIVLDRPLTVGETTRFVFHDGEGNSQSIDYNLGGPGFPLVPAVSNGGMIALATGILVIGWVLLQNHKGREQMKNGSVVRTSGR